MQSIIDYSDGHIMLSVALEGRGRRKYDFMAGKDNIKSKVGVGCDRVQL